MDSSTAVGVVAGVLAFFFVFFIWAIFGVVWILGLVFWIIKLVEVATIPDYQFRAAGSEKTNWILVVVLAQIVGAVIWQFAKRNDVLRMARVVPPPPPGWYPDPTGGMRWWDGYRWTEMRNLPPPPTDATK